VVLALINCDVSTDAVDLQDIETGIKDYTFGAISGFQLQPSLSIMVAQASGTCKFVCVP
jgi:hypothetical protein